MVAGGAVVMVAGDWITPFAGVGAGGAPSEGGTDADGGRDDADGAGRRRCRQIEAFFIKFATQHGAPIVDR